MRLYSLLRSNTLFLLPPFPLYSTAKFFQKEGRLFPFFHQNYLHSKERLLLREVILKLFFLLLVLFCFFYFFVISVYILFQDLLLLEHKSLFLEKERVTMLQEQESILIVS